MTTIIDALKFVKGSVAKKDFLPALTHFVIEHGTVRGYNGVLALCSPIPFDIACKPKADTLIRAISNCSETVQLSMTPAGRLSVRSGAFKAFVECVQGDTPHAIPEGQRVEIPGEMFMEGLKAVAPFIGDDAARRWTNGVFISNKSMFATNNVSFVQYWLGFSLPMELNIPREAVKEMLRIDEPPEYARVAEGNITFFYSGNRWLRTQLYDHSQWPDAEKIVGAASMQRPIHKEIFAGLEVLKPFVNEQGAIYFGNGCIYTHTAEGEDGASFEIEGFSEDGCYHVDILKLLAGVAETVDWSSYPKPVMFQGLGTRLRGALIGRRK